MLWSTLHMRVQISHPMCFSGSHWKGTFLARCAATAMSDSTIYGQRANKPLRKPDSIPLVFKCGTKSASNSVVYPKSLCRTSGRCRISAESPSFLLWDAFYSVTWWPAFSPGLVSSTDWRWYTKHVKGKPVSWIPFKRFGYVLPHWLTLTCYCLVLTNDIRSDLTSCHRPSFVHLSLQLVLECKIQYC